MPALGASAVPSTVDVLIPTFAFVEAAALRGSMARKDRALRRMMQHPKDQRNRGQKALKKPALR